MLLCTKCTIVTMWFSGPFRHQVLLKSYVEEEILPPWAIQQIPQETLDEHVARPVERIAYTPFVCLLQLAISDQARGFSIGRRYRKCDDFNLVWKWQEWRGLRLDHIRRSVHARTEQIQGAVDITHNDQNSNSTTPKSNEFSAI